MRDVVSATRTGKPEREFPKLLTPQTKKANQDKGKLFLDFQVHNNGTLFVAGIGYAIRAEALLSTKKASEIIKNKALDGESLVVNRLFKALGVAKRNREPDLLF